MAEKIARRAMTRSETLEILTRQGVDVASLLFPKGAIAEAPLFNLVLLQIGVVPCGNFAKCGTWIRSKKDCHRDHKIALKQAPAEMRSEYDRPWNMWFLCLPCHDQKTNKGGVGLAIGSDAARNAKLRRRDKKLEGKPCRAKAKIPSRPLSKTSKSLAQQSNRWPEGRKIRSAPFSRPKQ